MVGVSNFEFRFSDLAIDPQPSTIDLTNLPAPREDEPESLRQDIVDELADHLACAVRREMVAGSDEPSAWVKTLEKFGDPRLVARRLWWQAMRSRIMSQRLSLVVQVCTLAACAALVFVAWQMQEGQRTQQEAFLAALAKLTEPRETKPATPPETRLAVQLKTSSPDDPLPTPFRLHIEGTHLSNSEIESDKLFDNKTGRIDFGQIPPGAYFLRAETSFGYATRRIEIATGENRVEEFALPGVSKDVPLAIEVERPELISQEDWNQTGLCVYASFQRLPLEVRDTHWVSSDNNIEVVVGDEIARVFTPPNSFLGDPQSRASLLEEMNRQSRIAFEKLGKPGQPASSPSGARYRLTRMGVITHPLRFQSQPSIEDLTNPPIAVIWDRSHPDFPAWANANNNVFVVGSEESPSSNGRMLPWALEIPDAMAHEVLAQIKQNAEFTAEMAVWREKLAEQKAAAMAAKERASRGPTQNRVRIRFVEGTADGPAAVRPNQVALVLPGSAKPLTPVVDGSGWADFGYLDAGLYSLEVQLSSGAAMSHSFVVHPQKDYEETIVCPPEPTPIVTRKVLIPVSKPLQNHGIEAHIEWDYRTLDAERWDHWRFFGVVPFMKASNKTEDSSRNSWTAQTRLSQSQDTAIVGEYNIRPLQIRPKSIQLNWPRPNEPGVSVILGRAQLTDQSWLDPAISDDPITIGLPPDLLTEAEAELKKFTPTIKSKADLPTQNRVRVRFVEGATDGPAVQPYHLALALPGSQKPLSPILDDSGTADFGYLEAGLYSLKVTMQDGAVRTRDFIVHPQQDYDETIVCPPPLAPVVTRPVVVPLSEKLRKPGVSVSLDWECKHPEAEKWTDWNFRRVEPFARLMEERRPEYFSDWILLTKLSDFTSDGAAKSYHTRPMLVRPTSAKLEYRPKGPFNKVYELAGFRMNNYPWIDLGKLEDDPLTIKIPQVSLGWAEDELEKQLRREGEEAAVSTPP